MLALPFATSLLARGQAWALLGCTQVDSRQDHGSVQITRRDCFFHTIRLRVSDAIFFDHLVVHFGDGTSEELVIRERIQPEGRNSIVELPGEPRLLESVELWYYKEPSRRDAMVSLYGIASGSREGRDTGSEH